MVELSTLFRQSEDFSSLTHYKYRYPEGIQSAQLPTKGCRMAPAKETDCNLTRAEDRVVAFARSEPLQFGTSTAREVALACGTSDATVSRTARKLGFSSFKEWKRSLTNSAFAPVGLDSLITSRLGLLNSKTRTRNTDQQFETVIDSIIDALRKLRETKQQIETMRAAKCIVGARSVLVYGLGVAFSLADYMALSLQRLGQSAYAIAGSGHTLADTIVQLANHDVCIFIAPRILMPDLRFLLDESIKRKIATVLITTEAAPAEVGSSANAICIRLPELTNQIADDTVIAMTVIDTILASIAVLDSHSAISARKELQALRTRIHAGQKTLKPHR